MAAIGRCMMCEMPVRLCGHIVCDACARLYGLPPDKTHTWPAWARELKRDWERQRKREQRWGVRETPLDELGEV